MHPLKKQIKAVAENFVKHVGSDDPEYIDVIEKRLIKDITALVENGQFIIDNLPCGESKHKKQQTEILDI